MQFLLIIMTWPGEHCAFVFEKLINGVLVFFFFTDDALFHLSGIINKQNIEHWSHLLSLDCRMVTGYVLEDFVETVTECFVCTRKV